MLLCIEFTKIPQKSIKCTTRGSESGLTGLTICSRQYHFSICCILDPARFIPHQPLFFWVIHDDVMERLLIVSDRLQCDLFINVTFHWHSAEAVRERGRKKTHTYVHAHILEYSPFQFSWYSSIVPEEKAIKPKQREITPQNELFIMVSTFFFALFFSCSQRLHYTVLWVCFIRVGSPIALTQQ